MDQFSTLSLSLPPIPNILRATSPSSQGSAIHVFLVLDYHPTPPSAPRHLPEKVWLDAVTVSRKRLNKGGVGDTVILTEGEVALFS